MKQNKRKSPTSTSSHETDNEIENKSNSKQRKIRNPDENNNYSTDSSNTPNDIEMENSHSDDSIMSAPEENDSEIDENPEQHTNKTKNPVLPTNATLSSEGMGKVILIRPLNDKFMSFTRSPTKFARAFGASAFGNIPIKTVRSNKIKNIMAVELENPSQTTLNILLQITKIGTWDVICSLPIKDKLKFGVISPIDLDEDLEELKYMIEMSLLEKLSLDTCLLYTSDAADE